VTDTLPAVISRAVSAAGYWLPGPGCEAAAQAVTAELEASQRRTIRIQTLLDEQRDQARKLQQQINVQAGELDRARAEADRWRQGLEIAETQLVHLRRTVAHHSQTTT